MTQRPKDRVEFQPTVTTATESSEKPALHYLTIQDILWINLQVTKKVQHFNYARLEEGTFYQYGYGRSTGSPGRSGSSASGKA